MRLRRNDLPDMEVGETRTINIKIDGPIGDATVSTATASTDSSGITFGSLVNGTAETTFTVTAAREGTYTGKVTFTLSNSDVVVTPFRVLVLDSARMNYSDDYGSC